MTIATAATGASAATTQATVFQAFTATGKPTIPTTKQSGYCVSGSAATDRVDAYRCLVKNGIIDPCFASALAPTVVVCPYPTLKAGWEIRLTKPLPIRYIGKATPSIRDQPLAIETVTGAYCFFSTGGTAAVGKVRENYGCSHGGWLWGYPNRSARPWWTILVGPTHAPPHPRLTKRVGIRRVWM